MHRRSFRRRIIPAAALVLAVLAALALFAGCGRVNTGGSPSDATVTVTDCAGRKVQIPENCERIAALDSFSAEAMVMAGAGSRMCACPNGTKSDEILKMIYPELPDVPVVKSDGAVNVEGLASLGADVAFIKLNMLENEDEMAKLDKMQIPCVAVGYETMEEQIKALELVGEVCGGDAAAKTAAMTDYYRKVIGLAEEKSAKIPEEEKVTVYHGINEIARTDGKTSLGADWIRAAGAVNVSAGEDVNVEGTDYQATLEQIYAWDPDVVICNAADTVDYLYSDSKWTGLRAVREKQVKAIPVGATRWGQRGSVETFFAVLWLGCEIYPEQYKDVDLKKEVVTFYKEVLGVDVDDELYDKIISGRGLRTSGSNTGGGKP